MILPCARKYVLVPTKAGKKVEAVCKNFLGKVILPAREGKRAKNMQNFHLFAQRKSVWDLTNQDIGSNFIVYRFFPAVFLQEQKGE